MNQTLYIKNMVCPRCVMAVEQALEDLGVEKHEVELGKAEIAEGQQLDENELEQALNDLGFELLRGHEQQKVEQIKAYLINYVKKLETKDEIPKVSEYLAEKMHQNYASLSKLFSEEEDITIEKYLIHLKIERVKELLSYGEMTLSEIAWKLQYSSVQYLSNQFRKITGMSVTDFKKASDSFRNSLDSIE